MTSKTRSKMEEIGYYSSHSLNTDAGKYKKILKNLPNNIEELLSIVHGLIVHLRNTRDLYQFKPKLKEIQEVNSRYMDRILKIILEKDPSPLWKKRVPRKRFFGSCYDFSLTLCSILRNKKIPARLRYGYANYFEKGKFWDHIVCEYWSKEKNRWAMVDPEIGKEERETYDIPPDLDNTDIKHGQFETAGHAWRLCLEKRADPNLFGPLHIGSGLPFIRGSLLLDFVSLNKVELLPWDVHPLLNPLIFRKRVLTKKENNLIDLLAELTEKANKEVFPKIRSLYETERSLKIDSVVWSYRTKTPVLVRLRKAI